MGILATLVLLGAHGAVGAAMGDQLGAITNHLGDGFGGKFLERTYASYATLPMNATELEAQGWVKTKDGKCNPDLGWQWTQGSNNVTVAKPIILYTTQGGQISGVGVLMTGDLPDPQKRWAQKRSNGWQVDVAFRSGDIMCSGKTSDATIGDILTVNPSGSRGADKGEQMVIPLTEQAIDSEGWHRGSCFDGMGWHRYLDTEFHNTSMSWKAENVFPVVAMYSGGSITAVNFITWDLQQGFTGAHQWDTLPSPSSALCGGMCDSACKTFTGTHFWSTLHIYFRHHTTIKCEPNLKCEFGKSGSGNGILCCAA